MRSFFYRAFIVLMASLVLSGQGCTKGPDQATREAAEPKQLEIWAVVDDRDAYSPLITAYQDAHPHVRINYKRFRLEEYEDLLINAFAEDRGPDIFLIHNTWVSKYISKIEPMPAFTEMVYTIVEGGYTNRSETLVLQNEKSITLRELKQAYPDVVYKDAVRLINTAAEGDRPFLEEKIMGLPMSVDTLALFVNRDMLNTAGIPTIPTAWDAFQATINRLVSIDTDGEILQAGAALGTTENVERATDIISILMMQNGTQMATDEGFPTFSLMPEELAATRNELPAIQALRFYTDFADETKEIYSWNEDMPNSLDAFVQGRLAYFFGYSYHIPLIKARAPKLNLSIARLPQIEGNPEVNYANYWLWTVSKKSEESETAWNFLNYLIEEENEQQYLDRASRPPAHRSLIENYLDDEDLGVFASQILTADSWYRGYDPEAMEEAMAKLIEDIKEAEEGDWDKILRTAQQKVDQTLREPQNP
ncbi:extracellular solute-binding protein [Candidatus Uhrbacteria bacterium]|nr:extracellular solute-binding protein [Candidatus Uhrbacteria bacterium]